MLRVLYFVLVLFFAFQYTFIQAQQSDAALWVSYAFDKKIDQNKEIYFKTQARFNENYSSYVYSFADIGYSMKLNKVFAWEISYVFNTKRTFCTNGT